MFICKISPQYTVGYNKGGQNFAERLSLFSNHKNAGRFMDDFIIGNVVV